MSATPAKEAELLLAATKGDVATVTLLSQDPIVNVNTCDEWKATPLFRACSQGHTEVVKVLLRCTSVDVNKAEWRKMSPLIEATMGNHLDIIKLLVNDPRVDVNHVNALTETALSRACSVGALRVVESLLGNLRVDVTVKSKRGQGLLFTADNSVLKLLLHDTRFDVNEVDNMNATVLWRMAWSTDIEGLKLLFACRSVVDTSIRIASGGADWNGTTPAEAARVRDLHSRAAIMIDEFERDRSSVRLRLWQEFDLQGGSSSPH